MPLLVYEKCKLQNDFKVLVSIIHKNPKLIAHQRLH